MIRSKIKIANKLGLHARAATKFAKCASQFSSTVEIGNKARMVDGKSIMSVMAKIEGCIHLDDENYFFENPELQYKYPILTVRDGKYNLWQKIKYYSLYPLNIRKIIYFGQKQHYFKRPSLAYRIYFKFLKFFQK